MYGIWVASSKVEKELGKIPVRERGGIVNRIRRLAENPRPSGIKALASNVYRLRIGLCRVIYELYDDEKVILIGRFARESERTYRNWGKLF